MTGLVSDNLLDLCAWLSVCDSVKVVQMTSFCCNHIITLCVVWFLCFTFFFV